MSAGARVGRTTASAHLSCDTALKVHHLRDRARALLAVPVTCKPQLQDTALTNSGHVTTHERACERVREALRHRLWHILQVAAHTARNTDET